MTTLDVEGLRLLAQAPLFAAWEGEEPPERIVAARALMRKAIHKLIDLGPLVPVEAVLGVLRQCIEGFNRLDEAADRPWICTTQREDICDEFYRIADLTGLQDHPDLEDGTAWRDW
jgi:hypothetical protein